MPLKLSASRATLAVLALGLAAMLAANLPGHLSYDSVIQLHEGRLHVRDTWAPAIYSAVLGFFDAIVPGTGLYVITSGVLFYGSLAAMMALRPTTSWLAVPVAFVIAFSPLVLLYQGIVWKDILFANSALAGCIALAHAAKAWKRPGLRWAWLALALVLLALAGLVRQNGLIVAATAACALAWTGRGKGWLPSLAWGGGGLAAVLVLSHLMSVAVEPSPTTAAAATAKGVRILRQYDLIGAAARDPDFQMPAIDRANPAADDLVRELAPKAYSPERVDTLSRHPTLPKSLWPLPAKAIADDWRDLILERPGLYLEQRTDVFTWLVATPTIERCLPIFMGVDGPPKKLADLGMTTRMTMKDQLMFFYAKRFLHTPVYSHFTYIALALAAALFLLIRRDPADIPILALMVGALGFTASFFVISLACDFRYLYLLDLAGMAGLFYLACDPKLAGRRRRI